MAQFIAGIGIGMILTVNIVAYFNSYSIKQDGKMTIYNTTYSCSEILE